ncbi:MAG: glycosyltransferase [Defluviitaleaceae bacterium]|nr:glycosyltransferase [Defluviitaleaceae bacterium]
MHQFINILIFLNIGISILFTILFFYQFIYIFIPIFTKRKDVIQNIKNYRYAILIAARNEEAVIQNLIKSILLGDYPRELIDIFVVADNCIDNTANLARKLGAFCYERQDKKNQGKGYALDFLLKKIFYEHSQKNFDAFIVFDADNLLAPNYITEMNKTFNEGHKVITSYRNSKNYSINWISAGMSLWFLLESQYMNRSRMLLKTGCLVSGTGFLISKEIVDKNDGWPFFLLTEDIEFSVHCAILNERIAYSEKAMFYDEQPFTLKQSFRQRIRWAKGFYQVFLRYGLKLFKSIFIGSGFYSFDVLMKILPARLFSSLGILINIIILVFSQIIAIYSYSLLNFVLFVMFYAYIILFIRGLITIITEWHKIHCKNIFKITYLFTFPIFVFTYTPISLIALFSRTIWKPVAHTENITIENLLNIKK